MPMDSLEIFMKNGMILETIVRKIYKLQNVLNNRSRKKLGCLTPTQKMVQMLQGTA